MARFACIAAPSLNGGTRVYTLPQFDAAFSGALIALPRVV
jgi:hypothetical protein